MTETYARAFPCGCFIELDIAYDWVDGRVTVEEETVHKCNLVDTLKEIASHTPPLSLQEGEYIVGLARKAITEITK